MPYLVLLFIAVPVVELTLLIKVGSSIGAGWTLVLVLATGFVGAKLAWKAGRGVVSQAQRELEAGQIPADSLIHGLIVLCSGLLLLTPGIITDLVGLLFLLPFMRRPLAHLLRDRFTARIVGRGFYTSDSIYPPDINTPSASNQEPDDIIDLDSTSYRHGPR